MELMMKHKGTKNTKFTAKGNLRALGALVFKMSNE